MQKRCTGIILYLLAITSTTLVPTRHALAWQGPYDYAVIEIDTLGGLIGEGRGINDFGVVTGGDSTGQWLHAFTWSNGTLTDMGVLDPHPGSKGQEINNFGWIAGGSGAYNPIEMATLWKDGEIISLGTLGGDNSHAFGINDSGQVVGKAYPILGENIRWPFIWQDGVMTALEIFPNAEDRGGEAWDINNLGEAVGFAWPDSGSQHAVMWTADGTLVDLTPDLFGQAHGINNLGEVAGFVEYANAVIWRDGVPTQIHDWGLAQDSYAEAVNDFSEVSGYYIHWQSGDPYAFIWTEQTGMRTLEDLIAPQSRWELAYALDINDFGMIVGYGMHADLQRAYVATPVTPSIQLTNAHPGVAGQVNGIRASGLQPGTKVYFCWSGQGGGTLIPGCDVTVNALQLENPTVAGSAIADANGRATLKGNIPRNVSGKTLLFQAVIPSSCEISNLVVQTFE
ncbi:MAG: hypothetical protein D8M59_10870 [Planctomycetes bacterium]|nr:hypothetical protein [Planctomycetota bacterium]